MKIKTDVHAGMSYAECDAQRDWWKQQAQMMESFANEAGAGCVSFFPGQVNSGIFSNEAARVCRNHDSWPCRSHAVGAPNGTATWHPQNAC